MQTPACLIFERYPPSDETVYSLRGVNGGPHGIIDLEYLKDLVEADMVVAHGGARLKYVQLLCPIDEVLERLGQGARVMRESRGAKPLDQLMKMVTSRKTVYREQLMTVCAFSGMAVKSGTWVWSHR
jgi:hypothetical protein